MTTAFDAPHDELDGPYWSGTRIALLVVVIAMVAMWVWIYLFASRENPDRLTNRAYPAAAEERCAAFQAEIDEFPFFDTQTTIAQKATQVAAGTELTIDLVTDLETLRDGQRFDDDEDRTLLDLWFADWHAYIDDREAYVAKLDAATADTPLDDLVFTLTERSSGGFYTRTIEGFANVNDMASCHVPGDV